MDPLFTKDSRKFKYRELKILEFLIYKHSDKNKNHSYIIKQFEKGKDESFETLKFITEILRRKDNLTPQQRINYCNSQRHFIKLYLKELMEHK
jgi:hypothetical protein